MARHSASRIPSSDAGAPMGVRVLSALLSWMLLAGLLLAAHVAWAMWGAGLDTPYVSRRLEETSGRTFHTVDRDRVATMTTTGVPPTEPAPADGRLFAYLYIPALNGHRRLPVQEGVEEDVLSNMGAGHYPDTALPGEEGNASFAGHDAPNVLGRVPDLKVGDRIILEGTDHWWQYRVNATPRIVPMTDTGVVAPDAAGARYGLTLTTCWPMFSATPATQRAVVHATLEGWCDRTDGVPADLAGTHESSFTRPVTRIVERLERARTPVTGVLSLCCLTLWALADGAFWIASRRRARLQVHATGNPFAFLWMLQAGVAPDHPAVYRVTRCIPMLLLSAGLLFAWWRWGCPWVADTVPGLGFPHAAL